MANCTDRRITDICADRGPEYGPAIAFWALVAVALIVALGLWSAAVAGDGDAMPGIMRVPSADGEGAGGVVRWGDGG